MASRIFLEKHGDRLTLHAPDHPTLDARAMALGGLRKGGAWSFPTKQEAAVSKLARDLFGSTGDDGGSKVTLRVDLSLFGEGSVGSEGAAWLAGRLLARRPTHDSRVQLGEGVKLVRGGFGVWGGSRNHPALDARYGTVVDVEGVPRTAADLACQKYPITTAIVTAKDDAVVGAWSKIVVTREAVVKPAAAPAKAKAAAKSVRKVARAAVKAMKTKAKAVAKTVKAKSPKAAKSMRKAALKAVRSAAAAAKKVQAKLAKAMAKPKAKAKAVKSKVTKALAKPKAKAKALKAKVTKAKAKKAPKPAPKPAPKKAAKKAAKKAKPAAKKKGGAKKKSRR